MAGHFPSPGGGVLGVWRSLAIVGVVLAAASTSGCATFGGARPAGAVAPADTAPPVVLLWPSGAPGAVGQDSLDQPSLTIYRSLPPVAGPTTGVIVVPGGAFTSLARDVEGDDVARWLAKQGVTAFVLRYRYAPGYYYPISLNDTRRALRLVRANAAQYGLAPDRIGMMGFSAGGYLTATVGTQFDAGQADAADPIERQGSRPDFMVLGYPVISFVPSVAGDNPLGNYAASGYFMLGKVVPAEMLERLSAERNVTAQTPPTFLYHGTVDETVNVENSVAFYLALRKAGVPAELHTFEKADHGGGLNLGDPVLGVWPALLLNWMRGHGFLPPSSRAAP